MGSDTTQLIIAVLTLLLSVGGALFTVAFTTGGRFSRIEAEGKGYQAQIDRHDRQHTECDVKVNATREEFSNRVERVAQRIEHIEKNRAAESNALASVMGEIKAEMRSMKEALDNLTVAERESRHTPIQSRQFSTPDLIAVLTLAAQAVPLARQMLSEKKAA